jgi:ABC-type proline/glycine betaine transport system permease subunit
MKKEIRTWKLWWLFVMHIFALIGLAGLYAEYIISVEVNGYIQALAAIVLITLLAVLIGNAVNLLTRILKRKKLW